MPIRKPKPAEHDFVLHAEVYGAQVAVFHESETLGRWLDARRMGRVGGKATNAHALCVTDPKGVDWFLAYIPRGCPVAIVGHECLHLAWYILDSYGVRVGPKNHEALAYLQQHLAEQILARRKG